MNWKVLWKYFDDPKATNKLLLEWIKQGNNLVLKNVFQSLLSIMFLYSCIKNVAKLGFWQKMKYQICNEDLLDIQGEKSMKYVDSF